MNWIYVIVGFLLTLNVYATELQSLGAVEQVAYEYALNQAQREYDNPQLVMGALDPRLRLQTCDSPLEAFNKSTQSIGKQTIGVKCSYPISWTVYVPVKVKVFSSVVVANRSLSANHIISKEDISTQSRDIGLLRQGYASDITLLIGQKLKYAMSMGTVINNNSVRPQKIVRRGEQIMLVAAVGEMEVRMSGTALADAQLGQRVKVKNSSSKRVVEGIVEGPGIVKVAM